ncbi:unnamed protein product [Candidula unifasciata]|uniref:G-protein coupled receptors family 1 profile domain-containing protein n=1 Tax=Candidula unifasciata TaxID=100452 RepID=A0A8S3Z8T4_9EUPU|nr:unnamed protein product [Candidula unifasciata]
MSTEDAESSNNQVTSSKGHEIFVTINFICLGGITSVFGIVTNIINMIVFYRQGFRSTTNISFFAMSVSDLCSLVFQLVFNIYFQPLCKDICMVVAYLDFQILTGGIPHAIFARITCFITVYVTAERYLCVVFPLHIKQMITRKRTAVAMIFIYCFALLCGLPVYVINQVGLKFYPGANISLLAIVPLQGHEVLNATEYFMHTVSGLVSFLAVVVLTSFLMITLNKKSKWRKTANALEEKSGAISTKDRKAIMIVVLVASVLIICYTPATILTIIMGLEPEFSMTGKYNNLYFISWSFVFLLENINASVNIFLYLKMNTKFRREFQVLFCSCIRGNQGNTAMYIKYEQ